MRLKNQLFLAVVLCAVLLYPTACTDPVGSDNQASDSVPRLTGTVSDDTYRLQAIPLSNSSSAPKVTDICAYPVNASGYTSGFDTFETEDQVCAALADDGSFEMEVPSDIASDYVLYLVDKSAQTRREEFVHFVGVTTGHTALFTFPVSDMVSDADLKTITIGDQQATSSADLGSLAEAFGVSETRLRAMAEIDNGLKFVKNQYVNHHPDTGIHYVVLPYPWFRSYETLSDGVASDVTKFEKSEYRLYVETNNTQDPTVTEIKNGTTTAYFVPPEPVVSSGTTYDTQNPFATTGSYTKDETSEHVQYNFEGGLSYRYSEAHEFSMYHVRADGDIADGVWRLHTETRDLAWFDLTVTQDVDSSGNIRVFVPQVTLHADSDGYLSKIVVDLWLYSPETERYEPLENLDLFEHFASGLHLKATDYSTDSDIDLSGLERSGESYVLDEVSEQWKLPGSTSATDPVLEALYMHYMYGGMKVYFTIRP